jgi:hypothetical protein
MYANTINRLQNLFLEVNVGARLTRERCDRFFEDDANIGS